MANTIQSSRNFSGKYSLAALAPSRYDIVAPWFHAIDGADIRLASIACQGGGAVYVDNESEPAAAWMAADDGFGYLAGDASAPGFAESVVRCIIDDMLLMREPGDRQVILFSSDDGWKARLDALLAPHGGFRIRRHTFAFDAASFEAARALLPPLPEGYVLHGLEGGCFDTGVFLRNEEAAWCCEGFSGAGKAETDVRTAEAHRRRGLALHASAAFIEKCVAAGMEPHWSCWDYNIPSLNLALKLGFRRLPDLEVNFCDLGC